jgi:uncharacterized protein YbjT (DUF2867 family)
MEVLVVGGTGRLGSATARALTDRGASVRIASRKSPLSVDVTTGAGLDEALRGMDVVIDATEAINPKAARRVHIDGTRNLLEAEARAAVKHHVGISIVGVDRVPLAYYEVKLEQEQLVEASPVPWTIVRATQFHEFIEQLVGFPQTRFGGRALYQPAAVDEVAGAVAEVALGEARRTRVNVAGPEVHRLRHLAELGGLRKPFSVPLFGRIGKPMRQGALTHPNPDVRTATTYGEWLRHRG